MKKLFYLLFGIKRYFIVSYSFISKNGLSGNGQISIISYGGYFLSKQRIAQIIPNSPDGINKKSIVVNNIIELSRSDYNDFNYSE